MFYRHLAGNWKYELYTIIITQTLKADFFFYYKKMFEVGNYNTECMVSRALVDNFINSTN